MEQPHLDSLIDRIEEFCQQDEKYEIKKDKNGQITAVYAWRKDGNGDTKKVREPVKNKHPAFSHSFRRHFYDWEGGLRRGNDKEYHIKLMTLLDYDAEE